MTNTTVTNTSIEFDGVNSTGSEFTNTNLTTTAVANFVNLQSGLSIRNLNTDRVLFSSGPGNQDFAASFTAGQIIKIIDTSSIQETELVCGVLTDAFSKFGELLLIIVLAIVLVFVVILFQRGSLDLNDFLITGIITIIFVAVINIIGVIMLNSIC